MIKRLVIDTASQYCTVGLQYGDQVFERSEYGVKNHATVVLRFVDDLIQSCGIRISDLDAIVYGKGPGSFTGLRIAACVTQGLAIAHDVGVIGVSTLAAIAHRAKREAGGNEWGVIVDARMDEVYCGLYHWQQNTITAISSEQVCSLAQVPWIHGFDKIIVGNGFQQYQNQLTDIEISPVQIIDIDHAKAQDLLAIASSQPIMSAEFALPSYIRNKVTS